MPAPDRCTLCYGRDLHEFAVVHDRPYYRCATCMLTFLPPEYLLSEEEEIERYRQHNNDPTDPRYRAFLSRLIDPMLPLLKPGSQGLDYGSGPGPTIQVIMQEYGHHVSNYDTYFAFEPMLLHSTYDFITCSETVEHFFNPASEFGRFEWLLRPGGILGIMTGILYDDATFADWWYVKDPTHVCFYRPETMQWIAEFYHWELTTPHENVAIYRQGPDMPR
ncbi:MAG: class I SAM-dependent methyltransferase [Litorilinea sp.]